MGHVLSRGMPWDGVACRPVTHTAGPESVQGPRGPQSCLAKKAEWGIWAAADPWRSWGQGICRLGEQCWVTSKAYQGPVPPSPEDSGFGAPPSCWPPQQSCLGLHWPPSPTAPTPPSPSQQPPACLQDPAPLRGSRGRFTLHPALVLCLHVVRGVGRATPRQQAVDVCPAEGEGQCD